MSNLFLNAKYAVSALPILASDADEGWIFGLDMQFLVDALIMACAMLLLFTLLSFLLFEPARDLMRKRQSKIDSELSNAKTENEQAMLLKDDYNRKLSNAEKEAEEILSESRKKAIKRENQIISEAKEEATRIIQHANKEAELEKSKMKDDVKKEMIAVATEMAGKFVTASISEQQQAALIDETLKEMGDGTWQS